MHLYSSFKARVAELVKGDPQEEEPEVHLTDEYLEFMQRQIDASKPKKFKLTPTSPSGW